MTTTPGLPSGSGGDVESCLSFEVSGPWAHFRRIEGNIVKQTYRVIPRTTVAGLIAAILGIERDGYYDLFAPECSAIAIEPIAPLRTLQMPMNTLSTAAEDMRSLNARGSISVRMPDPSKPRQQHNYEVLADPAYRIDVWLENTRRYEELRSSLESGKSHYVPSLGLSEHLANVQYLGEHSIQDGPADDPIDIDSIVPGAVDSVIPQSGVRHQIERTPAFMQQDDGGRTTSAFVSYAYNPDGDSLRVQEPSTHIVDGRTVVFT